MRVGVLIKQVPVVESLALGPDGRLVRAGLDLEINAYCRRAIGQGVELARQSGGTCTVFTLGPPSAEDALREAVAWGADDGVLISDPAFAGSDTLATARALAAAIEHLGPFDLILAGRNSVDADTGQVGPEVAQLLGLPFLGGVKAVACVPDATHPVTIVARLELDDGWADAEVDLPALLSCAERLCTPAKVDPTGRAAVAPSRLRRLRAVDLGPGPWGEAASPTQVGGVRALAVARQGRVLSGPLSEQVAQAVSWLRDAGALDSRGDARGVAEDGQVPDDWTRGEMVVAVLLQPDRPRTSRQLLGAAARLAHAINGRVAALAEAEAVGPERVGSWGADELVALRGGLAPEDLAHAVGEWAADRRPWALLAPGTLFGREVAARLAARLGAGLTGDAIDVAVEGGRLLSWKPAFGGQLVAAITSSSAVQLATIRPGMLATPRCRSDRTVPVSERVVQPAGRVRVLASGRDDDLDELATADVVVGVGAGVDPSEYGRLAPLLEALGAELAATRKVTDQGWQPRSRQLGLTGRSLAPRMYVAIGLSGKFNHLVGVRGAGTIVAINHDPDAKVFAGADIGIVGDWRAVVPLLVRKIGYEGWEDVSA